MGLSFENSNKIFFLYKIQEYYHENVVRNNKNKNELYHSKTNAVQQATRVYKREKREK